MEDSSELYYVYKKLDVVLTGRFHGLIMAALTGKPTMNVSIANHKQKKLIDTDLPSLASGNYRLEQLYEEDLFSELVAQYKKKQLPVADSKEVDRCHRLTSLNQSILDYYLLRGNKPGAVK
jgi:polysaccharide pyruvyl transferase WcaK-like protein